MRYNNVKKKKKEQKEQQEKGRCLMSKKKGTRQYQEEFIRLYEAGHSIRSIAIQYGLNKGSVSRLIKEKKEIRSERTSTEIIERMGVLYQQGVSKREIAKRLNCAVSTVSKWLEFYHGVVPESNKPGSLDYCIDEIKARYEAGESLSQLADDLKVSVSCVHRNLIRHSTKLRSYGEASRKFALDETYFENLDSYKSYLLGQIYAIGGSYSHQHTVFVEFKGKVERVKEIEQLVTPFTEFNDSRVHLNQKDQVVTFRILSVPFYQSLTRLGFPNQLPLKVKGFDEDLFWKGFFKFRFYEQKSQSAIYLGFRNAFLCESFLSYWKLKGYSTIGFSRNQSNGLLIKRSLLKEQCKVLVEPISFSA